MSDLDLLVEPARPLPEPRQITPGLTTGDKVFRFVAAAAAASVLLILGLVALFLVLEAQPALKVAGFKFFTTFEWNPDGTPAHFGIAALIYLPLALIFRPIASWLVILVPVMAVALFYVGMMYIKDARSVHPVWAIFLGLLRCCVYTMLAIVFMLPACQYSDNLGFIPFFHTSRPVFGSSMFIAGIVVGLMVLPIVASVTREVLAQAPRGVCEAALALGGSRWGMIRSVILPFGRSGIVGAAMLGLGRALGETIAIALILAFNFRITTQILAPGGGSVAGLIANNFGEAGDAQRHALVAAGLALFVITLIVNTVARIIVNRTSKGKMED